MKSSIKVSAAIIHDGGKIFITRKAEGAFKGFWEFPGGKIEEGESASDAAVREIQEELSIQIEIEEKMFTVEYEYPDFHLVMDCFLAHIKHGSPVLSEHDESRWVDLGKLEGFKWVPADSIVVERLKEKLFLS